MKGAEFRVEGLPEAPIDAAAAFYADHVPLIRQGSPGADLVVIHFQPAGHEHCGWRLAAVQELARELAPIRINAVVGGDDAGIAETIAFLESAPAITGQLLAVDGKSGEKG